MLLIPFREITATFFLPL